MTETGRGPAEALVILIAGNTCLWWMISENQTPRWVDMYVVHGYTSQRQGSTPEYRCCEQIGSFCSAEAHRSRSKNAV